MAQRSQSGESPPTEPSQEPPETLAAERTPTLQVSVSGPASASPAPAPAQASVAAEPARIRRNTACVRCRDAKVKCNASLARGRPCLRCSKLELPCVVDKSHKRTSRRSKLEELAAEVQTIKDAVVAPQPQPQPQPQPLLRLTSELAPVRPMQLPNPHLPSQQPLGEAFIAAPPPSILPRPRAYPISSEAPLGLPLTLPPPLTPAHANDASSSSAQPVRPAEPRALGSRVFSGDDIDYYFGKYFEHFHSYLPVVRARDPDTCYRQGPVLFWAVVMTACRRFARDDTAFQFLVDSLLPQIWSSVSQTPLHLPIVNALLILATWPFPTIRFVIDPSLIFAGIAMNSAFLAGLHTGRGSHLEFKAAVDNFDATDEEASYAWAACAIISHRVSAYMGLPSPSSLFNKTVDQLLDGSSPFSLPHSFHLHLETARFANRVNRTLCASLEEAEGVSHHLVAYQEEEFAKVQRLLYPENSDLDHFTLLSTLLEIQTYYFMPLPGYSEELFKRNVIKCYTTAESLIHQATRLHRETAFLHYAPHFVWRSLLSAICVVMSVHLSAYTKGFQADTVDALIAEAIRVLRTCSVQEGDLHARASNVLERFWEARDHIPRSDWGVSVFTHRLGASLTFDCLRRWKKDAEQARDASGPYQQAPGGTSGVGLGNEGPRPGANADLGLTDPFQRVDWNAFMDDFDWTFTSTFLSAS